MGKKSKGRPDNNKKKKKALDEEEEDLDEEEHEDDDEEERKSVKKKGKRSRKGLFITIFFVAILIIVVVIIAFWGFSGEEGYPTPEDVITNKAEYINKTIEVKGTVGEDSYQPETKSFKIVSGSYELNVTYSGGLPTNFKEGTDVVVKGLFQEEDGVLKIVADEVVVGCPSKY